MLTSSGTETASTFIRDLHLIAKRISIVEKNTQVGLLR